MNISPTHRTLIQEWIDSLKIAILESNTDRSYELTQNLPFSSDFIKQSQDNPEMLEYLTIARELIGQTITMLKNDKEITRQHLEKIKQAKKFLI